MSKQNLWKKYSGVISFQTIATFLIHVSPWKSKQLIVLSCLGWHHWLSFESFRLVAALQNSWWSTGFEGRVWRKRGSASVCLVAKFSFYSQSEMLRKGKRLLEPNKCSEDTENKFWMHNRGWMLLTFSLWLVRRLLVCHYLSLSLSLCCFAGAACGHNLWDVPSAQIQLRGRVSGGSVHRTQSNHQTGFFLRKNIHLFPNRCLV